MRTSSFAALVLAMLAVAVAVFLLTPHERRSTASSSTSTRLWSIQR